MKGLQLLPKPRSIRRRSGIFPLRNGLNILLNSATNTVLFNSAIELSQMLDAADIAARVKQMAPEDYAHDGDIVANLDPGDTTEEYRISITPRRVSMHGGHTGLFYAIRTLMQIIRSSGTSLPCCLIKDSPAFAQRGFYLDISRGRVPTLDGLKQLVNRMAALKLNHLQLYVEHVFDFRFDPEISAGCDPLTADEILQLDSYCAERHIQLVPSLACFGHMGRILSLPAYRRLAEIEWPAQSWEKSPWRRRLQGATINPRDPDARKLIRHMLDEYLPLFRSGLFNMCGDETYDLGRGKNAAYAKSHGVDRLYLDHVDYLRKQAARHDKRLMFWGDVMLQHPRAIRKIPADCTILDWGYSPRTEFSKVRHYLSAGLPAYVCPSTRGYQVVFNQTGEARGNITGYARAGRSLGATGMLTTDWGDAGHFNMRACSLHGLALGAAMSWNTRTDSGEAFDKAFSLQVFGDRTGGTGLLYRQAGNTPVSSWPLLLADLPLNRTEIPSLRQAQSEKRRFERWIDRIHTWKPSELIQQYEIDELELACRALVLNAKKIVLSLYRADNRHEANKLGTAFTQALKVFSADYAKVWLASNKPSCVKEIQRALSRVSGQQPVRTGPANA